MNDQSQNQKQNAEQLNGWSDGSTADYYQLPPGATELQHLISARDMNAQIGEIFRAAYRYGKAGHSSQLRDAKKMVFYAKAEVERLEKLGGASKAQAGEGEPGLSGRLAPVLWQCKVLRDKGQDDYWQTIDGSDVETRAVHLWKSGWSIRALVVVPWTPKP